MLKPAVLLLKVMILISNPRNQKLLGSDIFIADQTSGCLNLLLINRTFQNIRTQTVQYFFSNRDFNDRTFIEVSSQNENYAKNSFPYSKNTFRTEDQIPFDLTTDDSKPENTKLIDYNHYDDGVTSVFNSHGGLSNWVKQPHSQAMVNRPRELLHPGFGDFGPSMVDENHAKDSFPLFKK